MANRKITTVTDSGRIGITSLSKAEEYVSVRRAVWEYADSRHGGVRLDRIRFVDLDHRNQSADVAAQIKVAPRGFMQASEMPVSGLKEMRGVPIMTPEKMLYKIPSVKARKPGPCVVLRRAGNLPGIAVR